VNQIKGIAQYINHNIYSRALLSRTRIKRCLR